MIRDTEYRYIGIIGILLLALGCNLFPRQVAYNDKELAPFLRAIAEVNRDSLGFTTISENDDIRIQGKSRTYDAMLHIYGKTSRTISFVEQSGKYVWVGEQEIHSGPGKYTTPDGTFNEEIIFTFETQPISSVPINEMHILYQGPDSSLSWPNKIQLNEALKMVKSWDTISHGE